MRSSTNLYTAWQVRFSSPITRIMRIRTRSWSGYEWQWIIKCHSLGCRVTSLMHGKCFRYGAHICELSWPRQHACRQQVLDPHLSYNLTVRWSETKVESFQSMVILQHSIKCKIYPALLVMYHWLWRAGQKLRKEFWWENSFEVVTWKTEQARMSLYSGYHSCFVFVRYWYQFSVQK
jgi:hypothetical protein